jgi:hypothetical protein
MGQQAAVLLVLGSNGRPSVVRTETSLARSIAAWPLRLLVICPRPEPEFAVAS